MRAVVLWLFLGYFIVLFAERVQSVVRIEDKKFFRDGFNSYVNIITFVSLAATAVLLIFFNKPFWLTLFGKGMPDYTMLSITAGVILVSGMVHTEKTIAPVQFGAYGLLILAMILRTVTTSQFNQGHDAFPMWYSLIFVVMFSMAIPVMYPTKIKAKTLFYIIEAITSIALVVSFTMMLQRIMHGAGTDLLWICPMAIVLLGDTAILWMRWKEEKNLFLLIFEVISVLMFAVGKFIV